MKRKNPLRDVLVRTCTDKAFREEFLRDPAGVLERTGIEIPAGKNLKLLENSDTEMFVVLPSTLDDQPANWARQERPEPGEKREAPACGPQRPSSRRPGLVMTWDEDGLALSGSIDSDTAMDLREELDRVSGNLVLDFSDVKFMSSAGISVLIATQKRLAQERKDLTLYNVPPTIKNVFVISGLDAIFTFIGPGELGMPGAGAGIPWMPI